MALLEFGAVTIAVLLAYLVAVVLAAVESAAEDVEIGDARPFVRRVFGVFVLVEIGAHGAVGAVLGGVI